jgi:hypothetical protein
MQRKTWCMGPYAEVDYNSPYHSQLRIRLCYNRVKSHRLELIRKQYVDNVTYRRLKVRLIVLMSTSVEKLCKTGFWITCYNDVNL